MEPILSLKGVGFRYEKVWALRQIDLGLEPGEIMGILGPNGSGKSTLLKIMDGLSKPQEGEILLNGLSLSSLRRSDIAKKIAMVVQESYFRFPFSVFEVVLMGRFPHLGRMQFEGEGDLEVAQRALKLTHTERLAKRSIDELSGGEKQRVLIARALTQEPEIILLDEPTSFLDLKYKGEIFKLITQLNREEGLSVVVVSHDLDLVAQYCHQVMMLKNGRQYIVGPPERVITAENIKEVYDCSVVVDQHPSTGRPRVSLI